MVGIEGYVVLVPWYSRWVEHILFRLFSKLKRLQTKNHCVILPHLPERETLARMEDV